MERNARRFRLVLHPHDTGVLCYHNLAIDSTENAKLQVCPTAFNFCKLDQLLRPPCHLDISEVQLIWLALRTQGTVI